MTTKSKTPRKSAASNPEAALLAEIRRQKRYQHFRPWYEDATVVDLHPGDGFGFDYVSRFAVRVGKWSGKSSELPRGTGLVLGFGLLNDVEKAADLGGQIEAYDGSLALSFDRERIEAASRTEVAKFVSKIEGLFAGKTVRFLSQDRSWPFCLAEGIDAGAASWIAVFGERALPCWPKIGIAIPTIDNAQGVALAALTFARVYPGASRFVVVSNESSPEQLSLLRQLQNEHPALIRLIEEHTNLGYGAGCNKGLAVLKAEGGFGLFGVSNDDVIPAFDCLCEMAEAMRQLDELGYKPGMIGPMSNCINGAQQVDIGAYGSFDELWTRASDYHRTKASTATQAAQVRGLLLLIHPTLIETIGGFDPRFGIGNFEDDDFNLRAKLAGFSTWIAEGAFLHHEGSKTFKALGVDYGANIERNAAVFMDKWQISDISEWPSLEQAPVDLSLFCSLEGRGAGHGSYAISVNGESIDLVSQATEIEFAAWMLGAMREHPRPARKAVVDFVRQLGNAA